MKQPADKTAADRAARKAAKVAVQMEDDVADEAAAKAARKAAKRKARLEEAGGLVEEGEERPEDKAGKRHKSETPVDPVPSGVEEGSIAKGNTKTKEKRKAKSGEKDEVASICTANAAGESAGDDEAIAAKRDKKKLKKEKERAAKRAKAEERAAELADREAKNKALREKGKPTKKELYLARKAAKKSAMEVEQVAEKTPNKAPAKGPAAVESLDSSQTECFLTGLPYSATEQHIVKHFESLGPCRAEVLRDHSTGKSRGTGFVSFQRAEDAARACALDGSTLQGRWIKVRLCEVRNNGKRKTQGLLSGPGEKPDGCVSIVVTGLLPSVEEDDLWTFFEDCKPQTMSMMTNKQTGEFRGMAFVDFADSASVDAAVKLSGHSIKGKPCFIRYKGKKSEPADDADQAKGGKSYGNRIAPHNRAPPVPAFAGKATQLESDAESE